MPRTTPASPRRTRVRKPASRRTKVTKKAASPESPNRVQALLESSRPVLTKAQGFVNETGRSLSKQTRALRTDLAHRVADIGTRVDKERRVLGRRVEGAVKSTLASLNIPTRSEINLLARRVEELSRKIEELRRR